MIMVTRRSFGSLVSPAAVFAVLALLSATAAYAGPDVLAPTGKWTGNTEGAAKTPPMGWNSWNAFRTEVDEDKVAGAAQVLVDSGLSKLGYTYINLDDGWWLKRRSTDGRMIIRTKIFPSARTGGAEETSFRPFTDRMHGLGLKVGIYTDIGRNACSQAYDLHSPNLPEGTAAEREVGLDGHTDQDIDLYFRQWGFDYIKVDACGAANFAPGSELVAKQGYNGFPPIIDAQSINRTDVDAVQTRYRRIVAALKTARPNGDFVLSICNWGTADVRRWGKDVGNMWRTSGDITPTWTRMLHNFDSVSTRALYAGPGTWNDPDILDIGHGEFDENHLTEARSHFSLWAVMAAPLLISYDLRTAPKALMNIWGNADLVRIDQDPAGNQGVLAYDSDDVQIIVKTLNDPAEKAVVLFNRENSPQTVTLTADQLKFDSGREVMLRDLWSKEALPPFTGEVSFTLAPHEARPFSAKGSRSLPDGIYLSEMPGAIHVAADGTDVPRVDPTVHRMPDPWAGTRSGGSRPQYTGWGGAQIDATPYGQTLTINGKAFLTGLGVLSNSRLEVKNTDHFAKFEAVVGVDDSSPNVGRAVKVFVYGDGRLLARSMPLKLGEPAQFINADITGVSVVELVARDDHKDDALPLVVTWADARLRH